MSEQALAEPVDDQTGTWSYAPRSPNAAELARLLRVAPITAHLLTRAGFPEHEAAEAFLRPSLKELHDPALLPNMEAAVTRLQAAIQAGDRILLFADYDVDGITGAAVLDSVLTSLGAVVEVHIPDRHEGYGLNLARCERAVAEDVKVVITIDNGIAAVDEGRYLAEQGLDLIVCDHHTFAAEFPPACALVHPRMEGSEYPNPNLCGAGVAFKLAWAIAQAEGGGRPSPALREELLRCMGLVAMGTVADVVDLVGENRVLVRFGLKALSVGPPPGLRALFEPCRLDPQETTLSTTDVSFRIAPRINAAGRMGQARRAFDLLRAADQETAEPLAAELEAENKLRRELQDRVYAEAVECVEEAYLAEGQTEPEAAGLVVWGENWPHGVVGIVAARLTEDYGRPALVASVEEDPAGGKRAKGSGRTAGGVDLLASLEPARPLFRRLGGHAAALGFTIEVEGLEAVREAFHKGVLGTLGLSSDASPTDVRGAFCAPEVTVDAEVSLEEVNRELIAELDQLAPFGAGNREPVLASRNVHLAGEPRLMGKTGQHLSFMAREGDRVLRVVAFKRPDLWETLSAFARRRPGQPRTFELAFRPKVNRWKGSVKVELELVAIRLPPLD